MAKKSAVAIVKSQMPGFRVQQAIPKAGVRQDARRAVAHSPEAEALLRKYFGKNGPVTASSADAIAAEELETVDISPAGSAQDASAPHKLVVVSKSKGKVVARQG